MPDPVPRRRRHPTETIRYLTQDEVQAFFAAIRTARLPSKTRDLALFTLVYKYGLRASEVGLLTLQDVDFSRGRIRLKRLKGGVTSEWPLFRDVQRHLKAYLATRTDQLPSLFPSRQQGRPLGRKRLDQLYRFYAGLAGLPPEKRHVHCLRHAIATHLLDAGQPLELVADLLGHKNLQSTQVYAKITPRRREAAVLELERSREVVKVEEGPRAPPALARSSPFALGPSISDLNPEDGGHLRPRISDGPAQAAEADPEGPHADPRLFPLFNHPPPSLLPLSLSDTSPGSAPQP